jgi:hypothetical protein
MEPTTILFLRFCPFFAMARGQRVTMQRRRDDEATVRGPFWAVSNFMKEFRGI